MSIVRLVVQRELREKLRSRAFWIMNAVITALILAATVLPVLLGNDGPQQVRYGSVGDDAAAVLAIAAPQAEVFGFAMEVETVPDEQTGRAMLSDGELDVLLVGTDLLVGRDVPFGDDVEIVDAARRIAVLDGALAEAGLSIEERGALLAPPPLTLDAVLGAPERDEPDPGAIAIGLASVALLYGLLIFYGQQVAQGIVQEKQSRVIEVLLATMRPVQLLGGKLLGLGLLGLLQILGIVSVGALGMAIAGRDGVPDTAIPTVVAAALWFVLGFALYASLFALSAAAVSKSEDLQTAMMAPILVLVVAFALAQFTLAAPDSLIAKVAGVLPFSAPVSQPLQVALGTWTPMTGVLGVLSLLATTAIVVPVAARVHAGAALEVRQRISLREALRRSRG